MYNMLYTLEFRCRILYDIQGSSAWPIFQLIYLSENPIKCSIKGKLLISRNCQRHLSNFPSKVIWFQDIVVVSCQNRTFTVVLEPLILQFLEVHQRPSKLEVLHLYSWNGKRSFIKKIPTTEKDPKFAKVYKKLQEKNDENVKLKHFTLIASCWSRFWGLWKRNLLGQR